jgi:hypothetical protein
VIATSILHSTQPCESSCPSYNVGLTNGETQLAILRALALVQIDVGEKLAALEYDSDDDDDDDDEADIVSEVDLLARIQRHPD